jgi:hypothetical protein
LHWGVKIPLLAPAIEGRWNHRELLTIRFTMANPPFSELADPPEDFFVEHERGSSSRFRARDSMGALRMEKAEIDAAYARGHANGIEEGREEGLDIVRTTLFEMLEKRFGEVSEEAMHRIEQAEHSQLRGFTVATLSADTLSEVFR